MCSKHLDFETLAYKEGPEKVIARFQLLVSSACKSPGRTDSKNIDLIHELPKDKFEEIEDNGHESCGYCPRDL